MKIREILKLIDGEIEYQEKLLQGNFELDKPIHWRIIGMKELKNKILEKIERELDELMKEEDIEIHTDERRLKENE